MKLKSGLLLATALFSLTTTTSASATSAYQIDSRVYNGGKLVASPVMIVEADKLASMSIGSDFDYKVTLTPMSESTVKIATSIRIGTDTTEPEMVVEYGKPASVEIGSKKLSLVISKAARP